MLLVVALFSLAVAEGIPTPAGDLLRAEGFSGDGAGAIAYLQSWVPDPERLRRLQALIVQLGDDNFDQREEATRLLRAAGPAILADLRRAAETGDDLEVRRRARELLDARSQRPTDVVLAALTVLRLARPPEADAVLLRFAPHAPDAQAEEALLQTAASLGPTPLMRIAVADANPARRRLGVCALGQPDARATDLLRKALMDSNLSVRCEASRSLVRLGEREGLAGLVEGLKQGDLPLAWRAEDMLWRIARDSAPPVLVRTAADRVPCHKAWQAWLVEHGPTVDLTRQRIEDKPRDWILVADDEKMGTSPGHVRIFDLQGQPIRAIENLESPADVELLPGDRMLLAEHWSGKVTERTLQGKILWELKTQEKPVSALRQRDGSTLIATYGEILELDRTGAIRTSFRPEKGMLYGAAKHPSGRLVFITGSGQVCETDTKGTILREFKPEKYADGASYWASIEILGPDRFLLSLSGADRVVEVNGQGKILWEATAPKPTYAQRLPDGTTLVSCVDDRKYIILDAAGKTIQTVKLTGRPFRARRY